MKKIFLIIYVLTFFTKISTGQAVIKNPLLCLNQEPPGLSPKVFAPDIISTKNEYEFGIAVSDNADKIYYAVRLDEEWNAEIRFTELKDGIRTKPAKLFPNDTFSCNDPFLSTDENRLYFMSNKAENSNNDSTDSDLWYIRKTEKGWSEPVNLGMPVNSDKNEFYISFSNKGTIYFASNVHTTDSNMWDYDIYYAEPENEKFKTPVRLNDSINTKYFEVDAFISPDETYMIFCSVRPGGYGEGDLYISFKNDDSTWSKAINPGETINTKHHEFCPFVTKDGKYLFYTSKGDIYWVDSQIIYNIRENNCK